MISLPKNDLLNLRGSAMPRSPNTDPIRIWCEQELVLMRRQMEFLQSEIGTYEWDDEGSQNDTSSQTAKQLEMKITALESLLSPNKGCVENDHDDWLAFNKAEIARE
jgi:hypothetical protein